MTSRKEPTAVGFRPASMKDFKRYAKNLSWLIKEPYQKTQNLLARIYGYADLHEMQKELKRADKPHGPYTQELTDQILHRTRDDIRVGDLIDRDVRVIELLGELRGSEYKMSKSDWDAKDIGLFEEAWYHRKAFAMIRTKHEVLRNREKPDKVLAPGDYAKAVEYDSGKTLILEFTEIGRGVFDALQSFLPEGGFRSEEDYEKGIASIEELQGQHPNNPWISAALLIEFAERRYQGPWDQYLEGPDTYREVDDEIRTYAEENAKFLEPLANKTIRLFEAIFNGGGGKAPDPKLVGRYGVFGADNFYWPASLYWGSLVTLNAGKEQKAYRWMLKHNKIANLDDGFGSRNYVAAMRLNRGKGSVRALYKTKGDDLEWAQWCLLVLAADAFKRNELKEAAKWFVSATLSSWMAAVPFIGEFPELDEVGIKWNIKSRSTVEEFMYRTGAYWENNPEAHGFFAGCIDRGTRLLLIGYHQAVPFRGSFEEGRAKQVQLERAIRMHVEDTLE